MAYQKLQASNVDVPDITVVGPTGSITAETATTVTDNTKDFNALGVKVGMILVGSRGDKTNIIGVNGDTLTISNALGASNPGDTYEIFGGNQNGCVLYVGVAGSVTLITSGGDEVTLQGVPAGTFIPVQTKRVMATGTTASGIIALW
jgi:hypothetical protein